MRFRTALVFGLLLSGCASTVSSGYIKADRETYEAISPDYVAYIDSDTKLSEDDKSIKKATLKSWKQRIEHFEGEAAKESK